MVSSLDGIRNNAGDAVEVGFETDCNISRRLPLIEADWLTAGNGVERGPSVEYSSSLDLTGDSVRTEVVDPLDLIWFGESVPGEDDNRFSARLTGYLPRLCRIR